MSIFFRPADLGPSYVYKIEPNSTTNLIFGIVAVLFIGLVITIIYKKKMEDPAYKPQVTKTNSIANKSKNYIGFAGFRFYI
jgi:capsular polysaccharide biosynthesis protein